jgi:hypothetical protein
MGVLAARSVLAPDERLRTLRGKRAGAVEPQGLGLEDSPPDPTKRYGCNRGADRAAVQDA